MTWSIMSAMFSGAWFSPPPLRVAQMVYDGDGDDGVGGAGPEGEREAVRPHGEEAAVVADPHEVLAKVTADLKSI